MVAHLNPTPWLDNCENSYARNQSQAITTQTLTFVCLKIYISHMHRHYTTMVRNRMDLVNYGCLDLNGPRTRKVQGTSSMYKHSSTHWQVKRRGSLCTIKVGCVAGMKVGTPHHRTQQSEDICYLMGSERERKKKRKEKKKGSGSPGI